MKARPHRLVLGTSPESCWPRQPERPINSSLEVMKTYAEDKRTISLGRRGIGETKEANLWSTAQGRERTQLQV